MKKIIILSLCSMLAISTFGQIPPGYYNSAAGLTGAPLQLALHNIIKSHTVVSYSSLWTHFQNTDKKPSGKVWDMYSDVPGGTPPYQYTFVSDQCGSYSGEGDCYNREHSWPQSWFASATTPSSDLFHIYPTDGYVNNIRGNYPYGDADGSGSTSQNGSILGFCTDPGYTGAVFEPIDEYKGDLARSYFYMSTRYMNEDASWSTSPAVNKSVLLPWQASVLLQWSHADPVSAKETARNNVVYGIQDNRNPFIDHPEWADSIWTMLVGTGINDISEEAVSFSIYPNPAADVFQLENLGNKSLKTEVKIINAIGQEVYSSEQTINPFERQRIDCSQWSSGVYSVSVFDGNKMQVIKVVKW